MSTYKERLDYFISEEGIDLQNYNLIRSACCIYDMKDGYDNNIYTKTIKRISKWRYDENKDPIIMNIIDMYYKLRCGEERNRDDSYNTVEIIDLLEDDNTIMIILKENKFSNIYKFKK